MEDISKIKIEDFHLELHISGSKYHSSKYIGTINSPGSSLDGKKIVKEAHVPISYKGNATKGNTIQAFYINEPKSPTFNTLDELIKHYLNTV